MRRHLTSRARKLLVIYTAVSTAALAVAGGARIYARTARGQATIAHFVERAARTAVPGLRVARVGPAGGGELIAADVDLLDAEGVRAVHVDRIRVRPHWPSLLRWRLRLDDVRLEGLAIDARTMADGRLNLTSLVRPSKQPDPHAGDGSPGKTWSVRRLEIVDAHVSLRRDGGTPIVISSLGLDAHAAGDSGGVRVSLDDLRGDVRMADQPAHHVTLSGYGAVAIGGQAAAGEIAELRISGLVPDDDLVVRASAHRDGSTIALSGSAKTRSAGSAAWSGSVALPGAGGIGDYQIALGFRDVAPASFGLGLPSGHVSGRVTAGGSGVPLRAGSTTNVEVSSSDSTLNGFRIRDLRVLADANGDRWSASTISGDLAGAALHASAHGVGPSGSARVEIDVARTGSRSAPRAVLPGITGRAHAVAILDGRWPDQLAFRAVADAKRLDVDHRGRVAGAKVTIAGTARRTREWSLATNGRAELTGLVLPDGAADAATLAWALRGTPAAPTGFVTLQARGVRVPKAETSFATVSAEARGTPSRVVVVVRANGAHGTGAIVAEIRRRPRNIDVRLAEASASFGLLGLGQQIKLVAPMTIAIDTAKDEISVSGLRLHARGSRINGDLAADGTVALPGHAHRAGRGHVAISLRGATAAGAGMPPIDVDLVAGVKDARLQATLDARTSAGTRTAAAHVAGKLGAPLAEGGPALGWKLARAGAIEASLTSSNLDLATFAPLQRALARWGLTGGSFNVNASASGDVSDPTASVVVDVRRLEYRDVTGTGRDALIHRIPGVGLALDVAAASHRTRVSTTLALYGGGFAIAKADIALGASDLIHGAAVLDAPIAATFDVPRFQIAAFRSFSDELRDTTGWLSSSGRITGTLAHPRGTIDVTLADARVDKIVLGPVAAHAEADGRVVRGTLKIQAGAATTAGVAAGNGTLVAKGEIALRPGLPVVATIDARGVDPGFVRPFVAGLRELGGVVDAHIVASGAPGNPKLAGRVYFYRGRVGVVGEPTFQDIGVTVTLAPGRVDLDSLQMYSGGGSLIGKGHATLDGARVSAAEFTAHARKFVVAAAGVSGSRLDGDISFHLARGANSVQGDARVPVATVWLPGLRLHNRHPQRILPHDDVRFVDGASRAASQRDAAKAASAPLQVTLHGEADTIYVRAKDVDLEMTSQLTFRTTPAGEPALFGEVRVRRGRINIGGQRFDLDDGRIFFDGPVTPRLDLELTHAYPDATVFIDIRGTVAHPDLRFRSDPAIYDQGQIISLVLLGHVGGAPGAGSPDPTATIATTVLGKLGDQLAPQLGLDVLRVERGTPAPDPNTTPGATPAGLLSERVEIGKYVSDRVFVSYSHVFDPTDTQNANEAQAEYRWSANWMAQTVFGDAGVGGIDAFWTHRY